MKFIGKYLSRFKKALFIGGAIDGASKLKDLAQDFHDLDANNSDKNLNDSFEQQMLKNGMTKKKLAKAKKMCLNISIFALILAVFLAFYLIICLFHSYYTAAITTGLLVLVLLGLAFRYHFWYMQITVRSLGCSFRDWLDFVFNNKVK